MPSQEVVTEILSFFFLNLREFLLQETPYESLVQQEILKVLRQILQLSVESYDSENDYCLQLSKLNSYLDFTGIPDLRDNSPIKIGDIFIKLNCIKELTTEIPPNVNQSED